MARLKQFNNEPLTSAFKYYKVIDGQDLDVQCNYNKYQGERCPRKGTISPNTNGYPPYYCSEHWDVVNNREIDPRPKSKKGFVKIAEAVKKIDKTRKFF